MYIFYTIILDSAIYKVVKNTVTHANIIMNRI